jgi:hypothetical protein
MQAEEWAKKIDRAAREMDKERGRAPKRKKGKEL